MPSLDTAVIVLAGIALFAAFVNGAIGYGVFLAHRTPRARFLYESHPKSRRRCDRGLP